MSILTRFYTVDSALRGLSRAQKRLEKVVEHHTKLSTKKAAQARIALENAAYAADHASRAARIGDKIAALIE